MNHGARPVLLLLAVAGFCLLGCPAPSWSLDASLDESRTPPQGKALRFTVESSQEPRVTLAPNRRVLTGAEIEARAPSTDAKKRTLIVFEGEQLDGVGISGDCAQAGCSGECEPPPEAFVTVSPAEVVPAWSLSDSRTIDFPVDEEETGGCAVQLRVDVDQKGPGQLRIVAIPDDPRDTPNVSVTERGEETWVGWQCSHRESRTFSLRAVVSDVCEGDPCTPPTDASVRIVNATPVPKR